MTKKISELPLPKIEGGQVFIELLRVWIVDGLPTYVITGQLSKDPAQWGLVLADVIRHLGRAYEVNGASLDHVIDRIKSGLDAEWNNPTK